MDKKQEILTFDQWRVFGNVGKLTKVDMDYVLSNSELNDDITTCFIDGDEIVAVGKEAEIVLLYKGETWYLEYVDDYLKGDCKQEDLMIIHDIFGCTKD